MNRGTQHKILILVIFVFIFYSMGSYVYFFQVHYDDTVCSVVSDTVCLYPLEFLETQCELPRLSDFIVIAITLTLCLILLSMQSIGFRLLPLKSNRFVVYTIIQIILGILIVIINIVYYMIIYETPYPCTPKFETCSLICYTIDSGLSTMWSCVTTIGFFCACILIAMEEYRLTNKAAKDTKMYRLKVNDETDLSMYPEEYL